MARIGYARVSTEGQELAAQLEQFKNVGIDKLFQEKVSSIKADRPQFTAMMDYVREGDTVIVCKLDRIARSVKHMIDIVDFLDNKKVNFQVLNMNLDTSTATGRLMLSVLAAIAQYEREMMLERQREGIRIAKAEGVYKGRQPTARCKGDQVMALLAEGKTKQAAADEVGISIASVYRIAKGVKP